MIDNLLRMLESGKDSPTLRFSLGSAYFKEKDWREAAHHFAEAVRQDPDYSAAWKLYGNSLARAGEPDAAREVYGRGIECARRQGDHQAEKEIQVFLKKLDKGR